MISSKFDEDAVSKGTDCFYYLELKYYVTCIYHINNDCFLFKQ